VASRSGAQWRLIGVCEQLGCGAGDGLRRGERGRRARDELGSAPGSLRDARSGLERCRGYLTHAGLPVIPMPCRALARGRGRPRAAGVQAERIPPMCALPSLRDTNEEMLAAWHGAGCVGSRALNPPSPQRIVSLALGGCSTHAREEYAERLGNCLVLTI